MESKKDAASAYGQTCTCDKAGCMCGHHNGHSHLMKWLVRMAAILIAFSLGYMMGELRGMLKSYDHGMRGMHSMRAGHMAQPQMMQTYDETGNPTAGTTTTTVIVPE